MSGRAWTTKEVAQLRAMAGAGATASEVAAALGRTRDACRSRAAVLGISFRQARATAGRLRLTPDIALRLRLAARARSMTPTELARQILSAVLANRNRDDAIDAELAKAAARKTTLPVQPVPAVPSFMPQPELIGLLDSHVEIRT